MGWNCHMGDRVRNLFIINTILNIFIKKVVVVDGRKKAGINRYTVFSKG
jgi:hypothetical protein